jgi:hypothetical protein
MEANYLLQEQSRKTTRIYTQNAGGSPAYHNLSTVGKGRLVTMYNLYLEYLLAELSQKDPQAAALIASNHLDAEEENISS